MNKYINVFILLCLAVSLTNATLFDKIFGKKTTESKTQELDTKTKEKHAKVAEAIKTMKKRQVPLFPLDISYMDYAAYDYYDWVCSNGECQVCDVLTGACCNPNDANNVNCFLPDSCANNPCLSGGTCVSTRTVQDQPDFTCVCQRGLTGKYCQLIDEFTPPLVGTVAIAAPAAPAVPAAQATQSTSYGQASQSAQAAPVAPTVQTAQPAQPSIPGFNSRLGHGLGGPAGLSGLGMGGLGAGLTGGLGAGYGGLGGLGGMSGMTGMAGLNGMAGMNGMAGLNGMAGMNGMAGLNGMAGRAGLGMGGMGMGMGGFAGRR